MEILGPSGNSLRTFLESAADAITVADQHGTIVFANAEAERLFGYGRGELPGRKVGALMPDRYRDLHERHHAGYSVNPQPRSTRTWLALFGLRKDGAEFPAEISLTPTKTPNGILVTSIVRDTTMRAEAANELHAYLASIVNSTEDAIISKGLDGAIRSWNRGAEKLFGYSASEMIGRSVATLVPRERSGEAFVLLERAKKGETITGLETERVRKGGQLFHVSVTVSPIRDAEGRIVGASKIARDITQWKRAEADLRRANQDLMQFSYAAAHDLQEPLRNISLLLGTLKDCRARHAGHPSASDADEEALIEEMTGNAHHMISMVRDLLAFTNVAEDGGQERAPVDANDILRQVLRSLAGAISESGVRISHGPLPMVKIAPTHLAQLLQNLIANAIKYRKRNEACVIEISATRRGAEWVFAVADNGIGFDPVYAERIFGIFKRLHQKKEYPGTGIGLALCSRIVANYGGRIWAEGRSGVGATFRFTVSAQDRVALPRRKNADCRGS